MSATLAPVPSATDLEFLRQARSPGNPQADALLGLGLCAYADALEDTDPELPDRLDEAEAVLAEARRPPGVDGPFGLRLALAAGTVRWRRATLPGRRDPDRAVLDAVIADLTAALGPPWSRTPLTGDLTAAHWDLAAALDCRARVAGRSEDGPAATAHGLEALAATPPGQPGAYPAAIRARATMRRMALAAGVDPMRLSMAEWATAAPRLRELLRTTPPEHEVRPILRLGSAADVVTAALRTQRWPDDADVVLAELRGVRPLWGAESSTTEHLIARRLGLALGCVRMFLALPRAVDAGDAAGLDALAELDDLRAELDVVAGETVPEMVRASMTSSLTLARAMVCCGLAMRVALAESADRPHDPADLDAIEGYLRDSDDRMRPQLQALVDLYRSGLLDDPSAVPPSYDVLLDAVPDQTDLFGARIATARAQALTAARNAGGPAVSAAVDALRDVLRSLPPGHLARPDLMALTANLLSVRSTLNSSPADAAAALAATVSAAETASLLGTGRHDEVVDALVGALALQVGQAMEAGPFGAAQRAIEAALADHVPADPVRHYRWLVGLGTALALQWSTVDEAARDRARQVFANAERLLRQLPADKLFVPNAMMAFMALAMIGVTRGDTAAAAAAARLLDLMDERIDAHPQIAAELSAMLPAGVPLPPGIPAGPAAVKAMLAQLRTSFVALRGAPVMPPPPAASDVRLRVRAALRSAADPGRTPERTVAVLTALLADGVPDPADREQLHGALGRCLAAAVGLSTSDGPSSSDRLSTSDGLPAVPDVRTVARLVDAIAHLRAATTERSDPLPTADRADLLDLLARCQRAASTLIVGAEQLPLDSATLRREALDSTRAVLRELFGAVQLDRAGALDAADRANRTALRAVHWCLADGNLDPAVAIAEAGRSLVLSSVVLSGRAGRLLRDRGRADLAEGWAAGDPVAMLAALGELGSTVEGVGLLAPPQAGPLAGWVTGAGLDAAVYLVPAAGPGTTGALLLVGRDGAVQVVRAPELAAGPASPVARYQEAFVAALAAAEADDRTAFRASPLGLAWAAALDELGTWTHRSAIEPLLRHTRTWKLGREPHVALIPLGALGAVPYAAAWTEDEQGGRRYAIHDLVLTQAASGRVLFDAARRRRLSAGAEGQVVLATDPTRGLPLARRAATVIARLYPDVVAYAPAADRDGPTAADVLAALPGPDRNGAALLHLATHGRAGAVPIDSTLEFSDRPLRLGEVLDQGRARPADAPGGLVICDACLTDATHAHQDESLTLATAFLSAGATAVIGTRWPTDDDTAAAFALKLHRELAAGYRPGPALRRAQLAMLDPDDPQPDGTPRVLRKPRYPGCWAEPATWAGYVHQGV